MNQRMYPLDFSQGSMACSRMSCKVLGSTEFNCRSSEARFNAAAKVAISVSFMLAGL
jgi:hypothetical protein